MPVQVTSLRCRQAANLPAFTSLLFPFTHLYLTFFFSPSLLQPWTRLALLPVELPCPSHIVRGSPRSVHPVSCTARPLLNLDVAALRLAPIRSHFPQNLVSLHCCSSQPPPITTFQLLSRLFSAGAAQERHASSSSSAPPLVDSPQPPSVASLPRPPHRHEPVNTTTAPRLISFLTRDPAGSSCDAPPHGRQRYFTPYPTVQCGQLRVRPSSAWASPRRLL